MSVNEHRKRARLGENPEIYLLAVNFMKYKRGRTCSIDSSIAVPFRWFPSSSANNAGDPKEGTWKFVFKDIMQVRGNRISYDMLKAKFGNKLSDEAVW